MVSLIRSGSVILVCTIVLTWFALTNWKLGMNLTALTPRKSTHTNVWQPHINSLPQINILRQQYLTLLVRSVSGMVFQSQGLAMVADSVNAPRLAFNENQRYEGQDWPENGYTIGIKGLLNIQLGLETAIYTSIPGDFLEAGVWRGGASIFAKGVLRAYGEDDTRKVWVCDSFKGLPKATSKHDEDFWEKFKALKVDQDAVRGNFKRFELLDDNVKFAEGYFVHSLPKVRSQVESLAVLRADGDMYESTIDILFNLYDKLSVGGMCIIDDYQIAPCHRAVKEFREMRSITDPVVTITSDGMKRYWIKTKQFELHQKWYKSFLSNRTLD